MAFKSAQALVVSESTVMEISTWMPLLVAHGEEGPAVVAAAAEETLVEVEARAHQEVLRQIDREDREGAGQ